MPMSFHPIQYEKLNSKQKESYNFQKVSAVLADLGFITIRMSSDWGGADFIAQHKDEVFLKVQLKSRLSFSEKYQSKNLFICFGEREPDRWYLYPHDEMLEMNIKHGCIGREFWNAHGGYTNGTPSKKQRALLASYELKPGRTLYL
jgi:hypothetical protein